MKKYSKRIQTLCALLKPVDTFADIGCDHGYCTLYMLENGLCKSAIFADISKGSLHKAEVLLEDYVKQGKAKGVLGNGFYGVPKDTQEVLIAGMGGSEIVDILSHQKYGFIPKYFVLQPMHDAEKLRRFILKNGGYIDRDFTFFDGKYYDVIVGGVDENIKTQKYSDIEYELGRENLKTFPKAFVDRIKNQIKNIDNYLKNPFMKQENKQELLQKKKRWIEALNSEINTNL